MTTKQIKSLLKKNNLKWSLFLKWMNGQTVGLDENGDTDWYETDVERFIEGRGNLQTLD